MLSSESKKWHDQLYHKRYTSDCKNAVVFSNQPELDFQSSSPDCGRAVTRAQSAGRSRSQLREDHLT